MGNRPSIPDHRLTHEISDSPVLDDAPNGSYASFSLDGDGTELYSTGDMGIGDQSVVEVNVEGVFRLTLRTNSNCNDYIGTWGSPTLSR